MLKSINFQNRHICYQVAGQGKALTLIHGHLLSANIWGDFGEILSQKYRVISIDLPGHGKSAAYSDHSMELMADVVAEVLKAEKVEKAMLIGHSLGGYVALEFLNRHVNLLDRLVLLNTYPWADNSAKYVLRDKLIKVFMMGKKDLLIHEVMRELIPDKLFPGAVVARRKATKTARRQSAESLIATTLGMKHRADHSELMKTSKIPISWILGSEDRQNNTNELLMQAEKSGLEPAIILPTGHMSFLEAPQFVIDCLERIIQT